MSKIINIFGGPGVGKSVLRSDLFSEMKKQRYKVEEIHEYAKSLVYGDDNVKLSDQVHMLGEQHHRQFVLNNKVDYIITDSPFIMGITYIQNDDIFPKKQFTDFMVELFKNYDNLNIFINRNDAYKYEEYGRSQTLSEAEIKDIEIKQMLLDNDIEFVNLEMGDELEKKVLELL